MLNRLIIFLIRRKLGVKQYQRFRFTNQKAPDIYYFSDCQLVKILGDDIGFIDIQRSGVSLNWLLPEDCEIECLSH